MEIFKLFGSIGIKNQDANRAIDETTGKAESASGRIGEIFKKMAGFLGTLFAGKAIFDFGKSVVEAAATAKAINAQFESVFGELEPMARKTVKKMADEMGILPNRLNPMFSKLSAKYRGLGATTEEAMALAARGTTLAADAAAFYDKSLEETSSALNSFINGNYEGGEAIGLFANETQLAKWASDNLGVSWKDLDEKGKQVIRLQFAEAMQEASRATGQASREANGFENVMGNLKQAWEDFKAVIGGPLLAPVVAGLQLATDWIGRLQAKFQEFEPRITLFKELVTSVYDVIFGSLSVKDNVDLLVKLGMDEATAMTIMDTASKIGAAVTSLYDMVFGSQSKKDNIDFMRSLGIDEATATSIAEIGESIRNAFDNVGQTIDLVIGMVGDLVGEFVGFSTSEDNVRSIAGVLEEVARFVEDATGKVKDFVSWFEKGGTGVDVLKSAVVGLTTAWTGYQVVTGIIQGIEVVKNTALALGNGLMLARFVQAGALTAAEGAQAAATMGAAGAFQFFNTVLMGNPIILIIGLIAALVAGLVWFFTQTEAGRQMWESFTTWLAGAWENLKAVAGQVWDGIKTTIDTVVQEVSGFVMSIWGSLVSWWNDNQELIKSTVEIVWNAISSVISTVIGVIMAVLQTAMAVLGPLFQTGWEVIKTVVITVWEIMKTTVETAINVILGIIKAVMQMINGDWSGAWETIKGIASSIWEGIKSNIETVINGISETVSRVVNGIKDTVSNVFNGIKDTASSIWDGIKSKISDAINGAKDAVDRAIGVIKSIMDFEWKLPHLKLPRISVSGDFSLKPLRVPSFGIEWFAKGGIMNQPTLFGMNGNNLMAGGEAGPEAILPLNKQTLRPIGQAVADAWGVNQSDNAGLLLEIIELLKALLLKEGDVYLDLEKVGRLTYKEHGKLMERGI